jgi:hypothetical protein
MRILAFLAAILCGLFAFNRPAGATVSIHIDLSAQRMHVTNGAGQSYDWTVSTARSGFVTPRGSYKPYSLQVMHYSRKYDMSPMPHSIFFHGGYAIHGTSSIRQLGRPASHGCIRLAPGNARALFMMVKQEGANITISGTPPGRSYAAKATGSKHKATRAHGQRWKHTSYAGRTRQMHPMAYAPYRQAPQMRYWLGNPARYY